MNEINNLQYVAGFFDGEGSISIFVRGPRTEKFHQLAVQVTNCDQAVLVWINHVLGGTGRITVKHRNGSDGHVRQRCWDLQWTSLKAEKVLEALLPYLKTKKAQAEIALEFRRTFGVSWNRRPTDEKVIDMFDRRDKYRLQLRGEQAQVMP